MAEMNLKIEHATVGAFRGGNVVPANAIDGGQAEIDRLLAMGAVRWTEEPVTDFYPAAASAVAEMDDDTLTAENRRLKAELEAVRQERNDALTRSQADGKAAADAEIARLKAEVETLKGGRVQAAVEPPTDGLAAFDAAEPAPEGAVAPEDGGETPIDQQGEQHKGKKTRKWG